MDGAM